MKSKNNYAIILCGGSGLRLWPLSRKSKPKQFLNINSRSISLFQKTVSRVSKVFNKKNIYIVINKDFYFEVLGQLSDKNDDMVPNILVEPDTKNTLPAISYAVMEINKISKNANIGVFPADHEIDNINEFKDIMHEAFSSLDSKSLAIFGIKPNKANISYGYIKLGAKLNSKRLYKVSKFIEKPSMNEAEIFIQEGYLWNSGMFAFHIECFISNLKKYHPFIYSFFFKTFDVDTNLSYKNLPNISIDKGLIEKSNECIVVYSDIGWTDLGTWNSVHNYLQKNNKTQASINIGNVVSLESKNSLIISEEKLTTVYGVDNMIIVNSDDALLVCNKDKSDYLKNLVDVVAKQHISQINYHTTVNRPWGFYKILHQSELFKIKAITVLPGKRLSMQLHNFRNEHWVVLKGVASVHKNDTFFELKANESTYIKSKEKHRLSNNQTSVLEIIEVSIGSKVVEDDIVRFEDDFGRK